MKKEEEKHEKVYEFTIDGKPFKTEHQFITEAEIKKLGNIPADYSIYLKVNGPEDDELIEINQKVDLSKKGTEHFYGCKPNTNNG